jgi:hypothetical protein
MEHSWCFQQKNIRRYQLIPTNDCVVYANNTIQQYMHVPDVLLLPIVLPLVKRRIGQTTSLLVVNDAQKSNSVD